MNFCIKGHYFSRSLENLSITRDFDIQLLFSSVHPDIIEFIIFSREEAKRLKAFLNIDEVLNSDWKKDG